MARFLKNREQVKGRSPGALIFVGTQKVDKINIRAIDYDDHHLIDQQLLDTKDAAQYKTTESVTWININGLHDAQAIGDIGRLFDLHPLVMEDILNTGQRPKIDDYESYIFIVLKMIRFDKQTRMLVNEQLSIVLADRFVLTFPEQPGDVFEPVRERIRRHKSRIRESGTDYLAFTLMDTVVENYIFRDRTFRGKNGFWSSLPVHPCIILKKRSGFNCLLRDQFHTGHSDAAGKHKLPGQRWAQPEPARSPAEG
ncbi:MAG: hypothetical protein LC657_13235 [Desulfobacteraceae bacterium]|nr:hypothetical protein [Desulfobacteraceae bacterium]